MKSLSYLALIVVLCVGAMESVGCRHLNKASVAPSTGADLVEAELDKRQHLGYALAESLERQGKKDDAIRLYERMATRSKNGTPLHRIALIHSKQGDFAKATEYYKRALELESDNADILADYGYTCYLAGDLREAEMNLRSAVELRPDNTRANNNLGLLFAKIDQRGSAIEAFRAAGCDESEIYANLGVAALVNGNPIVAKEYLERALSLNPQMESTSELVASIPTDVTEEIDPAEFGAELVRTPVPVISNSTDEPLSHPMAQNVILTGHEQ